jgi:hypothetical protein
MFPNRPPPSQSPYRLTPARQRCFVEALAETGSVKAACLSIALTPRAAYGLRRRASGRGFAIGWDAALLVARARYVDLMMEAAIGGVEQERRRNPATGAIWWRRRDMRLGRGKGMALLNRLDKAADRVSASSEAYGAAQDFEVYLALLGGGAEDREIDQFLARAHPPTPRK